MAIEVRSDRVTKARLMLPLVVGAVVVAMLVKVVSGVWGAAGRVAPALDDAYIHFQYARAFAEGHPFRYQAGEPISTGATSLLWPLVLAPFHALGFRGTLLTVPAWGLAFASWGALAYDAARLARPLTSRVGAATTALLVLFFGGHLWCAASGMEVIPFAWLCARTVRVASERAEGNTGRRQTLELVFLANLVALARPEGAIFTLAAAAALLVWADSGGARSAAVARLAPALATLAAPALALLVLFRATGTVASNTTAKLVFSSPYLHGATLRHAIGENLKIFFGTLLEGETWAQEFVPAGGAFVALVGTGALVHLAVRRHLIARGGFILLLAAAMLVPCFYTTFLWNRLRYLWPFATGWLIALACLAHVAGTWLGRFGGLGARASEALVGGALIGLFAAKLPWVLDDIATSARGIDQQQGAAGRWAKAELPPGARIGVNDAGAIAYLSERKTFDVVGLTTSGESRYWLAGPASRFEHYEKMPPDRLPTHFIVYPEWFALDALLGPRLRDFTVLGATILGGRTKRAAPADWSLLQSGELPWSTEVGAVVDTLDVADLESEAAHRYELLGAREGEQVFRAGLSPVGQRIADGGRGSRQRERFVVGLAPGLAHRVIARVEAPWGATLRLSVGAHASEHVVRESAWTECAFTVPPQPARSVAIEMASDAPATFFHYWFAVGE